MKIRKGITWYVMSELDLNQKQNALRNNLRNLLTSLVLFDPIGFWRIHDFVTEFIPVFISEVRIAQSLVFYVVFCQPFYLFLVAIVLSVRLRRLLITPLVSSNCSYNRCRQQTITITVSHKITIFILPFIIILHV